MVNSAKSTSSTGAHNSASVDNFLREHGLAGQIGDGSISGDNTSRAGETLVSLFDSPDFLDAGKASGVWFAIPDHVKELIRGEAENPDAIIAKIESVMAQLNELLARDDISDALKLEFLRKFLGTADGDVMDAADDPLDSAYTGLGTLIAEVMVGNPETMDQLFDDGYCGGDCVELDDIGQIVGSFEEALGAWMNAREVDVEQDTTLAWFASEALDASTRLKRLQSMSPRERVAEAEAFAQQMAERIQQNKEHEVSKLSDDPETTRRRAQGTTV